jgi:hypothetical protein
MARCNFTIEFEEPEEKLIERAKNGITSKGGTFEGNTEKGLFSMPTPAGKVVAAYTVNGNQIHFEIMDKPLIVGCNRIEEELRKRILRPAQNLPA